MIRTRNPGRSIRVVTGVNEQIRDERDDLRDDLNDHDAYEQARALLLERRPVEAAQIAAPLEQREQLPEAFLELLAQAYFASAQLGSAERVLRRLVAQSPANGWAHRALARTLERRSAGAEAVRYHRLADGFGVD
jgi:Flp pilus assembly protein TadD